MAFTDTPLQLIVGLGNPGNDYERTRHNAGADLVTELARQTGASLVPENRFFGLTARTFYQGRDLRLLIPTTYMNRSGQAVGKSSCLLHPPGAVRPCYPESG